MNPRVNSSEGERQLGSSVPALRLSASSPSVLIVEDEILLRMATADEFREGGFFVNEAANGG